MALLRVSAASTCSVSRAAASFDVHSAPARTTAALSASLETTVQHCAVSGFDDASRPGTFTQAGTRYTARTNQLASW